MTQNILNYYLQYAHGLRFQLEKDSMSLPSSFTLTREDIVAVKKLYLKTSHEGDHGSPLACGATRLPSPRS